MAKGQATAIGAVFLVIIIALSLSYVVWAISQIRELNEGLVKVISIREEYKREKITVKDYSYHNTYNFSYSSVEGSLSSECIEIGGSTDFQNVILCEDNFKRNNWECVDTRSDRPLFFKCLNSTWGGLAANLLRQLKD